MSTSLKVQDCSCCGTKQDVVRSFSEEALALLLIWGEIEEKHIDAPICEYCYEDLEMFL